MRARGPRDRFHFGVILFHKTITFSWVCSCRGAAGPLSFEVTLCNKTIANLLVGVRAGGHGPPHSGLSCVTRQSFFFLVGAFVQGGCGASFIGVNWCNKTILIFLVDVRAGGAWPPLIRDYLV